ncbi:MAG: HD domain-containing protein [Promethearchaeota archaeon]
MEEIIKEIEKECRGIFEKHKREINDAHGWNHVNRVRNTAIAITNLYNQNRRKEEEINVYEVEITALLHDVGRFKDKEGEHAEWSYELAGKILNDYRDKLSGINIEKILRIIRNHSFYKKEDFIDEEMYEDIEFQIITDADKIDSFGPIGLLRAPLDERYNSIEKQLKHIKDKADPTKYILRTHEGRQIGKSYKKYLKEFLDRYRDQIVGWEI